MHKLFYLVLLSILIQIVLASEWSYYQCLAKWDWEKQKLTWSETDGSRTNGTETRDGVWRS